MALQTVVLKVSTKKTEDGSKAEAEFETQLPDTLADAVKLEGSEQEVLRHYIASKVIELQGEERSKLEAKSGGKERKKASYLEKLGF